MLLAGQTRGDALLKGLAKGVFTCYYYYYFLKYLFIYYYF